MKKNKIIILITVFAIALIMSAGAVYSLFSKTIETSAAFVFGDADIELDTLFSEQEFIFEKAGDTQEASLTVKNKGQNALKYYFGIEILQSSGLEDMLMIYLDDVLVGMLSFLCQDGEYVFQTQDYLYLNEIRNHTLKIELHMGASYHDNKSLKIKINAHAKTLNNRDTVFVSNEYELIQAVRTLNPGAEIKLARDIELTSILQIDKDILIDLYGNNLILSANLVVANKTILKNTRSIPNTVNTGEENIVVNGGGALFFMEQGCEDYINSVELISFDSLNTEKELIQRISKRIGKGLFNGSYDIFENDIIYLDLFTQIEDEYSDYDMGILTVWETMVSKMSILSLTTANDTYQIEYKIYAIGTAATAELIAQKQLAYLYDLEDDEVIASDLFLPTRLKAYNSRIEWYSSHPNIISEKGRYTPSLEDMAITLIAFIHVEGDIYPYSFYLNVQGQSNEARFRYFLTRYGDILFTSVGEMRYLPVTDSQSPYFYTNYIDGRDLKIVNLSYDLDLQYDFLTLYQNQLSLSKITYTKYAQVNVHAEFEDGQMISGTIGVRIELGDAVFINDVFNYVRTQFEQRGDVLNNIYQNGLGDFDMPKEHLSLGISYEIDTSFYEAGKEPVYLSGQANPEQDEVTFHILPENFDVFEQYVIVTVEVLSMTRQMEFLLPSAIHNNEKGFESLEVFERVKSQLGTDKDYILIDFIKKSPLMHLDLSGLNLDESVEGLAYFSGITSLDVSGSASEFSCSTPAHANTLAKTISRLSQLKVLDMSFCNLANMEFIGFLTEIEELNLKGNGLMYIFNDILSFNKLQYLNLSQTGYHTVYGEPLLELAYFRYLNSWGTAPEFYYTDIEPEIEILFIPQNSHPDYVTGLEYVYNLSEIPEIRVQYTHLTTKVIINSSFQTLPISWDIEEDSSQTLSIQTETSHDYTTTRLIRSQAPVQDVMAVVSAHITVNSQTVTRYFYVNIRGQS